MSEHDATHVLPVDWALPAVDDTNRAWFTSGELTLQACASCGALQHPPDEICPVCGSMSFTTRTVGREGTVYSYTIVHHAVNAVLESSVPYAVVLVSLDEVPEVRVVGNLIDVPTAEVRIGLPVEAVWEERHADDGEVIQLPQWQRRTAQT
jgi:uncharacterized protein